MFLPYRSVETSSYSSHEEDQRLSTATKDSGIHSNCDLDIHEELSAHRRVSRNHKATTQRSQSIDTLDYNDDSNHIELRGR